MAHKIPKNIGISGLARAGKNSFADIFTSVIEEKYGLKCKSFALAYALKKDCEQFLKEKLDMNVWSENTDDKAKFRELLVWFGKQQRLKTEGRYWTNLLKTEFLDKSDADINLITDIRYTTYPKDELYWIKEELNGKLIHVSKYSIVDGKKIYTEPPNIDEAIHAPILEKMADIKFEWEHIIVTNTSELIKSAVLRDIVYNNAIKPIFE